MLNGLQQLEVNAHGRTHRFAVEVDPTPDGAFIASCKRISEVVRGDTAAEALSRMETLAREHIERSWRQGLVKGA